MNETVQLLQDVVRNARTGQDAIEHLMRKSSGGMRDELIREKEDYAVTRRESEDALKNAGGAEEPSGVMERAGRWMGLEMETLTDKSDAHIAELVIQGATMGVVEMTKALNSYGNADANAKDIANRFVQRQNDAIERQKGFLV